MKSMKSLFRKQYTTRPFQRNNDTNDSPRPSSSQQRSTQSCIEPKIASTTSGQYQKYRTILRIFYMDPMTQIPMGLGSGFKNLYGDNIYPKSYFVAISTMDKGFQEFLRRQHQSKKLFYEVLLQSREQTNVCQGGFLYIRGQSLIEHTSLSRYPHRQRKQQGKNYVSIGRSSVNPSSVQSSSPMDLASLSGRQNNFVSDRLVPLKQEPENLFPSLSGAALYVALGPMSSSSHDILNVVRSPTSNGTLPPPAMSSSSPSITRWTVHRVMLTVHHAMYRTSRVVVSGARDSQSVRLQKNNEKMRRWLVLQRS
ncbi:hypothetical protein LguiA_011963 [Lonicera macranthoides]